MKWRPALVAVAAGLTLTGCTFVPGDSAPRTIDAHYVPFNLLSKTAPHHPTVTTTPTTYVQRSIFLVTSSGHVVAAGRLVAVPANTMTTMSALLAGPTEDELLTGTTTLLSSRLQILSANQSGGTITLALAGSITDNAGSASEAEADGQLVLTALGSTNATAVRVVLNGRPVRLARPGSSDAFTVGEADYRSLLSH